MDFLPHNNKAVDGQHEREDKYLATDRNVIVIGGGDTGSDCIGTSNRHGAKSVTNFRNHAKPADGRTEETHGPTGPSNLKPVLLTKKAATESGAILTKEFIGDEKEILKGLKNG